MKQKAKRMAVAAEPESRARSALLWLSASVLAAVPIAFTTAVQRIYSLPKFALLVACCSAMVPLLILQQMPRLLAARQFWIVSIYLLTISASTLFAVAPVASLFGSSYSQMGLITYLCFFLCFIALVVSIGTSLARLRRVLWGMSLAGLIVAVYGFAQFLGYEPFISRSLYVFESADGPVVRVTSTLGHSNYLGNFLLYTTPLTVGVALASKHWRRAVFVAAGLSAAVIAFSGTRGAWLGLAAGALVFGALESSGIAAGLGRAGGRKLLFRAAVSGIIAIAAISIIASTPASRSIVARARSFITEGVSGSGRTLLWRDAIKMVPDFALVGCGPEGFRKAFLAYKSKELARLAPNINNESSHNSYLDAAISYGLAGAIAYTALIASTLALLVSARRRAGDTGMRYILAGLVSSYGAVLVHNLFIFDQIPTGLYFFAFAALAQAAANVVAGAKPEAYTTPLTRLPSRAVLIAACAIPAAAVWYGATILRADHDINSAFASAGRGDLRSVIQRGTSATAAPVPTGEYNFSFARALAVCADRMQAGSSERGAALEMGIEQASRALPHTLTPDSNYLLLAYLARQLNDAARLREWAAEAVRWDPNYPNTRWLMAEAHLANGEAEQAALEAQAALDLNPSSGEARQTLKRARATISGREETVEALVERGRATASNGNFKKARRLIGRAVRKSKSPCPACHRALAEVYEAAGLYDAAVEELRVFAREAPGQAAAEAVAIRIESLRHKGLKQRQ